MAVTLLQRARRAPVSFYAACGQGGREPIERLTAHEHMERVASPRHASVLVVAGVVPVRAYPALARLHDQLPHPRASVCWGTARGPLQEADEVAGDVTETTLAGMLAEIQQALLEGRRSSSEALLPDQPPVPWRGRGDHGQGGEGMMGGTPYGRPMAMPGDDLRDGLSLDAYPVAIGPFAPMFPPGLVLRVTLQGDVLQAVTVEEPPFADPEVDHPFHRALGEPTTLADLERRRAAHHLTCVAGLLRLRGLGLLAARCHRTAVKVTAGESVDVARLARRLRWSGLEAGLPPGLGALAEQDRACLSGPAARAAGGEEDRRSHLAAYRQLGFRPVIRCGGDVRARVGLWLDEAVAAMALAREAPSTATTWTEGIEAPGGPLDPAAAPAPPLSQEGLTRLLTGLEWSQAVAVLASFDVTSLNRMLGKSAS